MKYLDLSLPSPQHNLALDEALLDLCEDDQSGEILRFWESDQYFVVAGYSNKIRTEVHFNSCQESRIPILRRSSGGGTVLQGPGCLNYALILKISPTLPTKDLVSTTQWVMDQNRKALEPLLGRPVEVQGYSDLTVGGLKFSGNAQRRKKKSLLFHGTFLTGINFEQVERLLAQPSREPSYRVKRPHRDFLTNLPISQERVKLALRQTWNALEPFKKTDLPSDHLQQLVQEKYSLDSWNYKF